MPLAADYHVHPDYSFDAQGSIEDYCRKARAAGLKELCFTPHYIGHPQRPQENWVRVDGRRVPAGTDWPAHYLAAIARAQEAFPDLKLKAGLEVDYFPELEDELGEMLARYPFDFILGSVHCLDLVQLLSPEEAPRYFAGRSARDLCACYFEVVARAVASGLFDVLAHLDVYRCCGLAHYGPELLVAHRGFVEGVLEEVVRRGMGLEVNAAGVRRGGGEPYPARELLKLAREKGIARLTLGSDAHRPTQLGQDLDRSRALAREVGFTEVCTFDRRRPQWCPL